MLSKKIFYKASACLVAAFLLSLCFWKGQTIALDKQRALAEFSRETWMTENGLPQNTVHDIAQTLDGYIWIATEDGLVSNDVKALFEDSDGALWVGTSDGLSRLKDGKFTSYTAPDGLASNSVAAIAEDREGRVWVGTFHGLSSLSDGKFSTYT